MTDDELKQYTIERDALLKEWSKGVEADIPSAENTVNTEQNVNKAQTTGPQLGGV